MLLLYSHLYIVFICWVDIQTGPALESSSKPPIHKNKDISTSPEDKEVVNGQEEKAFSLVDQLNPEKSSPGIWNSDSNVITPSDEKKGKIAFYLCPDVGEVVTSCF